MAEVMELVGSLRSDNAALKEVDDLLLRQLSECHSRLRSLEQHAADIGSHCQLSHILQYGKAPVTDLLFQSMAPAAAADEDR